ncbi:FAD-dependent monooxygenase [Psychrosphaera sp.]|nr:FAD-dependent monooxygenase [Psychrosphaera sp.]
MISTDIVVIGGGCVGLTAALGLADQGYSVVVVDRAAELVDLSTPQSRVSALSLASQQILTNLNAWQHMESDRLSSYDSMKVWDKESFGDISFNAGQVNQSHLGHIVENNNIRNGLIRAAKAQSLITLKFETEITAIHNNDEQVVLTLVDGSADANSLAMAKLAIAADGAQSWVKKQLKSATTFSDYDHHAIVANIKTTEPHNQCARQVFLPQGPLALLPMFGEQENVCSIVWSTSPEQAEHLINMDEVDFNKHLTAATDSVLGPCEVTTARASFPLTMRYTQQWLDKRVIFIGDAAHTIHPLAGLGMNLGLLDAASLVECLTQGSSSALLNDQVKLTRQLREFERWRKAEAQVLIVAMASLKELFDGSNPIKKLIRGVGLKITNNTPLVKNKIIEQAMGISGKLPVLAQQVDEI